MIAEIRIKFIKMRLRERGFRVTRMCLPEASVWINTFEGFERTKQYSHVLKNKKMEYFLSFLLKC